MTLQDLTAFLLEVHRDPVHPLTETTIVKCVLLAYEMGLEQGRKEARAVDAGGR